MKTKKLLSILLALMMMLSVVPVYASAAEALKATNVTQWPTLSYKNADNVVHFGQTLAEALVINDDEIVLDSNGNQVAGHFEFMKPELISTPKVGIKANIKFVPDDTTTYSGFNKLFSALLYDVVATTPVYVDEINDPVVATEVEVGATLSTAVLSGGSMTNPYNANEPNILERKWEWVDQTIVVNESGYYEARFIPLGYTETIAQVYVKIAGEIPETTLAEVPTVDTLIYDGVTTWEDVELKGGKAVLKVEGTEVAGTFTFTEYWKTRTVNAGSYEVDVAFTPSDLEAALPYVFKIPVKVNPAHISFVDGEGNAVVEGFEFVVEPGTKMGDVRALLNAVLRIPANSVTSVEDSNSYAQNGRTYKLTVLYDENTNYTGNELYFTVKFKNVEVAPTFKPGYLTSAIDCGDYKPTGTFTVSLDGKEIATVKNLEEFAYSVENSGDYVLSAKYNPAENDYFIIADFETRVNVKLKRVLTLVNTTTGTTTYYPGDKVQIVANVPEFSGWKVTDANGNEVTVEGVDNASEVITITMPDYNITVEALGNSSSGSAGNGIDGIFGGLDMDELTQGDSEWAIINIIRNLIAKFKSFLQQLIETFQSIGD